MKRSDLLIVALAVVMLAVALMPLVAVDAGGDGTPTPDSDAAEEQAKAATAEAIPATPDWSYLPVIGACDSESVLDCYPNGAEFP